MNAPFFRVLSVSLAVLSSVSVAYAQSTSILFVGNSYTFGRTDGSLNPDGTLNLTNQVLTYNSGGVRDLTAPRGDGILQAVNPALGANPNLPVSASNPIPSYTGAPFTNVFGTNSYPIGTNIPGTSTQGNMYSPHTQTITWGGTAGIFKKFTEQAGLDYDVALSTRNAASLRGHLINSATTSSWDLRSNISSQTWNHIVLQDQSDEALGPRTTTKDFAGRTLINSGTTIVNNTATLGSNFPSVKAYVDLIEDWVHKGKVTIGLGENQTEVTNYTERDMFRAQYRPLNTHGLTNTQINTAADAACRAAGGGTLCTNGNTRDLGVNANASKDTKIYLQETWARPDLINSPGAKTLNPLTSLATYDPSTPAPSYFGSLDEMTDEMAMAMLAVLDFADDDGTSGITAIIPTGRSFLRAVLEGVATRDMYASTAMTDGLIDLWFNDGTHPSKWGSYLSALTTFQSVTGLDPRSLGRYEIAARELGISENDAETLQRIAYITAVPELETYAMMLAGLGLIGSIARRRKAKQTE